MQIAWMVVAAMLSVDIDPLAIDLLRTRGSNNDDEERAAFIVYREDIGNVALVQWPRESAYRAAHWKGPLPEHVIGVIHTHPAHIPRPSKQDIAEAQRLRLPFYVISRTRLCVADANGNVRCTIPAPRPAARPAVAP